MADMNHGHEETHAPIGSRSVCLACGYPRASDNCSECGAGPLVQIDEKKLLERGACLSALHRLILIAVIIEALLIVVTFVAPTLRAVSMSGTALAIMRIAFDAVLTIIPGILAAIATGKVIHGPWNISPATRISLQVAALLFLLYPACHLLSFVWYFNPNEILQNIIEWGYSMYSFTIFVGTAILIRGLGICSRQDPGGAGRQFLQHAWIGAVGLGILYETTMLALGRIWSNMSATGMPQNWGIDAVLLLSRALVGGSILYVLIWVVLMKPWKRMLIQCARAEQAP